MRCLPALLIVALATAVASCDRPEVEDGVEITVLALYTPAALARAGDVEARIRDAFALTNGIYRTGRLGARLTPVRIAETPYAEADRATNLARLLDPDDGPLDDVHRLRDRVAADLVVLVIDRPGATANASILATDATAFVILHVDDLGAPKYGLAHEIGHLHGARHAPNEDPAQAPFPYGHGFRNDSLMTIMAGGGQRRVPVFSGPDQTWRGAVLGDAVLHDNARVLRETAAYLSNFRGPKTPTSFVPSGTWPTRSALPCPD
jgi:peptidyl-Asp metalloendopeptidase